MIRRNKAGLWGRRSDKIESVSGHECKVFSASNVEVVTKTRLEHLSEADKARARAPRTPLQSFLGIAEQQDNAGATSSVSFRQIKNKNLSFLLLYYKLNSKKFNLQGDKWKVS